MFWRSTPKWHRVEWNCGAQRVVLSLQFAPVGEQAPADLAPQVERLPPVGGKPAAADQAPPDEQQVVAEVQAAVAEFNKRNRTALRVAGIRYAADNTTHHREATRKLLNRL